MIIIVARMLVREEKVGEFLSITKELVEKSAAEAGNVSYSLNRDIREPRAFAFIEFWKDQEAIDLHNATEHFTRIVPQMRELCEERSAYIYTDL